MHMRQSLNLNLNPATLLRAAVACVVACAVSADTAPPDYNYSIYWQRSLHSNGEVVQKHYSDGCTLPRYKTKCAEFQECVAISFESDSGYCDLYGSALNISALNEGSAGWQVGSTNYDGADSPGAIVCFLKNVLALPPPTPPPPGPPPAPENYTLLGNGHCTSDGKTVQTHWSGTTPPRCKTKCAESQECVAISFLLECALNGVCELYGFFLDGVDGWEFDDDGISTSVIDGVDGTPDIECLLKNVLALPPLTPPPPTPPPPSTLPPPTPAATTAPLRARPSSASTAAAAPATEGSGGGFEAWHAAVVAAGAAALGLGLVVCSKQDQLPRWAERLIERFQGPKVVTAALSPCCDLASCRCRHFCDTARPQPHTSAARGGGGGGSSLRLSVSRMITTIVL